MEFNLNVSIKEYFSLYLRILTPIHKLKTREIEVMGAILAVYYGNRHMGYDRLNELIFSKDVRKAIRKSINMSEASYNNHLRQLRQKGLLLDGNLISVPILEGITNLTQGKALEFKYTVNIEW